MISHDPSAQIVLLEVDDLVEDVLQDSLGLGTVLHLIRYAQDVSGLTDEVLQIIILTLVGQLRQTHLFLGEFVIQIEEFQGGVRQFLQDRGKDSRSKA